MAGRRRQNKTQARLPEVRREARTGVYYPHREGDARNPTAVSKQSRTDIPCKDNGMNEPVYAFVTAKIEFPNTIQVKATIANMKPCPACKGNVEIKYINPFDPQQTAFPTICTFCQGGGEYMEVIAQRDMPQNEFYHEA